MMSRNHALSRNRPHARTATRPGLLLAALVLGMGLGAMSFWPQTAHALGDPYHPEINIDPHVDARDQWVQDNYVEAFRQMTEQISIVMLQQIPIIGTFLDAKHQLETQRLFGEAAARAHREYHPSEQICAFGTLARSTSVSHYKVDRNVTTIGAILMKRELLNRNTASGWGSFSDITARMDKFKSVYCDPNDNNRTLGTVCGTPAAGVARRPNADIDYRRTVENNLTIDLDFTNGGAATAAEEDVLSLAKNLYSHQTFSMIPEATMVPYGSFKELHSMRALAAVRGVARHSYATITAMRGTGTGLQSAQLRQIMQNLGVPAGDVDALIGANPSYFAQMEILNQKMFQDPTFITNLYNSPANVSRMAVVMQALRIMSDRDKLDAALRREMLLSMIVEMRLRERQTIMTNETTRAISK